MKLLKNLLKTMMKESRRLREELQMISSAADDLGDVAQQIIDAEAELRDLGDADTGSFLEEAELAMSAAAGAEPPADQQAWEAEKLALTARLRVQEAELKELRGGPAEYDDASAVFKQFDQDGNGYLDENELMCGLSDFGLAGERNIKR